MNQALFVFVFELKQVLPVFYEFNTVSSSPHNTAPRPPQQNFVIRKLDISKTVTVFWEYAFWHVAVLTMDTTAYSRISDPCKVENICYLCRLNGIIVTEGTQGNRMLPSLSKLDL